MSRSGERRLLQSLLAILCLVPLLAGGAGMLTGPAMIKGLEAPAVIDLDSHFRYLSGLLFGIGCGFAACIPSIERRGALFGWLTLIVFFGGGARLASLLSVGQPSAAHQMALVMELGVVPTMFLWQRRMAALHRS